MPKVQIELTIKWVLFFNFIAFLKCQRDSVKLSRYNYLSMRWRLYFDEIFSSVNDFVSVPLIFSFKLSKAAINSSFEGIICTHLWVLERILQVPCAVQQKILRYPFSNTMCKEQQMKNFLKLHKRSANIPIISWWNTKILIINNVSW
jgi:hypothetical protein